MVDILSKNRSVFDKHKYDVGQVKNQKWHIKEIFLKNPYWYTILLEREIERQISKLL